MTVAGLTDLSTHYEFGRNWAEFARSMSPEAINQARLGFERLAPRDEIEGRDVLDIGCGSGLHALAALLLGARSVTAIDLDPNSVETTHAMLSAHAPRGARWTTEQRSVFDLGPLPQFDAVYSWGVLHHTGAMARAMDCAVARVAPGGRIYLALYRKTPLCPLWRVEKRFYTAAPGWARRMLDSAYRTAFRAGLAARGRSFRAYVDEYVKHRGMRWETDVKDWLGGYPYESISEAEALAWGAAHGLTAARRFCRAPGLGLFGTGCDEYAFARPATAA
jgi:SAM-dependent methyltransferase